MKIMITGCNGQLGSEIRKTLQKGVSELGIIPEVYRNSELYGVDINELDITNLTDTSRYIKQVHPDIIINCAAYTNVDACEIYQDDAFKVNSIGARNMAICAEKYGAKLIQVSTDYVFSGDATTPYREYDMPAPKSVYGATKLTGEKYVSMFSSRFFILRTSWLYGYVGKNFVKTIIRSAKENGSIKVINDQIGNPTNAADLTHHLLKIAAKEEYGIYHCTGNGECSWYDLACKIIEYSGIKTEVIPCTSGEYTSKTKRPAYSSLDHMMLRCTVSDEMRSWQDALKCFFENYKGE